MRRRRFLRSLGCAAATFSATPDGSVADERPTKTSPNSKVNCAVIGLGARGGGLVMDAARNEGAQVVAVCDVNVQTLASVARRVEGVQGGKVSQVRDFRELIADQSIDAIFVATPHHWHTPIALRAVRAGKHVYVEKPVSHVFSEGRLIVEAVKQKGVVFQHGTQMRSCEVTLKAAQLLKEGVLGEVYMSRGWSVEPRPHPAPVPDEEPPNHLDYDIWLGAAPERPYNRNRVNRWRWYRDYGNGEMGDDGIHDIDLARLGLGVETHPVRIVAHGARIELEGETEYPNHLTASFQYADGRELLYETRNWAPYKIHGFDSGNVFYGNEGYMVFSRRGYFQTYLGAKEKEGPGMRGSGGAEEHAANFIEAVRQSGKTNADATTAHLSCALVHLGEIAFRTGQVVHFDPDNEEILTKPNGDPDEKLTGMLSKKYREPWGLDG